MKYRVYYTVRTFDWIEIDNMQSVEPGFLPDGMQEAVEDEARQVFEPFDSVEIDHWEKVEG